MKNQIKNLIFDVNETLLDLEPLSLSINNALGDQRASELWFSQLLYYSLVETITGSYHDFSSIAAAVFKMQARKYDKDFSDEKVTEILSPIKELQAYPEVAEALGILKDARFNLIAFSNGKPDVLNDQLEFAGIKHFFDHILSVEGGKRYKPHPDAYAYALKTGELEKQHTMMVAAHAWDISGAQRYGLRTAFIQRSGKYLFPLAEKPTIRTSNILNLVKELTV
ncbi:haloacid dehalogenase type II [Gramella lutea]|uniref:Haloacid dehalogenase type II n=1 Tax=Christiangramia lutea TaxID=1607951 RepID=A0A9X2A8F8_9FLAO|nr:haloacid dehalogenase type II [Christiangramia lutea]MCH4822280.1 haloacid dehalogenase type II [Christiangramia lutea]